VALTCDCIFNNSNYTKRIAKKEKNQKQLRTNGDVNVPINDHFLDLLGLVSVCSVPVSKADSND